MTECTVVMKTSYPDTDLVTHGANWNKLAAFTISFAEIQPFKRGINSNKYFSTSYNNIVLYDETGVMSTTQLFN